MTDTYKRCPSEVNAVTIDSGSIPSIPLTMIPTFVSPKFWRMSSVTSPCLSIIIRTS